MSSQRKPDPWIVGPLVVMAVGLTLAVCLLLAVTSSAAVQVIS